MSNRLKGFARAMRRAPTEAERRLWLLLRDRRFANYKFRRQVPIGRYIAGFVCYESKLIIELDGSQHADSIRDNERDADLMARGFHLLRLWNAELLSNSNAACDAIWNALQEDWR